MIRRPRIARALAAAAALLALGACGSPSTPTAGAPAPAVATGSADRPAADDTAGPDSDAASDPARGPVPTPATTATAMPVQAPARTPAAPGGSAAPGSSASPRPDSARAVLATLAVKGRAAMTGYEREQFGQAWADVDRNGCDTRNDTLRRDLREVVFKPGTRDCVVLSGVLDPEPYTGDRIEFVRGETTSADVQIDHVVALADSWVSGAFAWDERKRIAFGNDPLNLLAVDGPANAQKGAGDAATWLPRAAFRCTYVARQIAIKAKYELWVKPAERDALSRVLDTCPDQPVAPYGPVELPPPGLGSSAPAQPVATPEPGSATDPRFAYCTEAKAAGLGPYYRGQDPEYAWYRDADSDGIVCE